MLNIEEAMIKIENELKQQGIQINDKQKEIIKNSLVNRESSYELKKKLEENS